MYGLITVNYNWNSKMWRLKIRIELLENLKTMEPHMLQSGGEDLCRIKITSQSMELFFPDFTKIEQAVEMNLKCVQTKEETIHYEMIFAKVPED